MRCGLRFTPQRQPKRSGMSETELRRKLRACNPGGLFFRLLTR